MTNSKYTEEELSDIREEAFINIKEACIRLQERTKCDNDVVIKILNDLANFYILQDQNGRN